MAKMRLIAAENNTSLSATGIAFMTRGMQQDFDLAYGAMLGPMIQEAIDKCLERRDNRLAALLVRIAYEVGQVRHLMTNMLGLFIQFLKLKQELLNEIIDESARKARASITSRTPQFKDLMEEFQKASKRQEVESEAPETA